MSRLFAPGLIFGLIVNLVACGDVAGGAATPDASTSPDAPAPRLLSNERLYSNFANRTVDARLKPYEPRFALWSDGLVKRRFLDLPAGQKIDVSDADHWKFPVGTRFWKEFSVPNNGPILETRLIEKVAEAQFEMGAFIWRASGDAVYAPLGEGDVGGTIHDVPSSELCVRCHTGESGKILGFSALQLGATEVTRLQTEGMLSGPVDVSLLDRLPWDDATNQAFGYMHANCGHCHNPIGTANGLTMNLRLSLADLRKDETETAIYTTTVGIDTTRFMMGRIKRVDLGHPDNSAVLVRMNVRTTDQMPPIATEVRDKAGIDAVSAWIGGFCGFCGSQTSRAILAD